MPNQNKSEQETGKTVTAWSMEASKINSTHSRIAKAAGIAPTSPASRQISQDNLKSQHAKLPPFVSSPINDNHFVNSLQEELLAGSKTLTQEKTIKVVNCHVVTFVPSALRQSQLKVLISEMSKGKSSGNVSHAADELQFLLNFNSSITKFKTLEHLTDFGFGTIANTTLARRDAYLSHLKMGIKPDTLAALRTGPLHIPTLFPDAALKHAEQDIANFESKGQVQ